MVENYIQYKETQNEQVQTLMPNLLKMILDKLFTLVALILLLAFILLFLHYFIDLSTYMALLEIFNINFDIEISLSIVLLGLFFLLLGILSLIFLWSYLVTSNKKFEFYQDKLVIYENAFFVSLKTKEIPYENILRITFNSDGLFNTLFNTGKIVLELSAMEEEKVELEFIDNIKQNVQSINKKIRESLARQYEKIEQNG
ncbi:MAG: hypothetical protein ACOCQG_03595 [Candidatus Nanoarchaeia archaeon]